MDDDPEESAMGGRLSSSERPSKDQSRIESYNDNNGYYNGNREISDNGTYNRGSLSNSEGQSREKVKSGETLSSENGEDNEVDDDSSRGSSNENLHRSAPSPSIVKAAVAKAVKTGLATTAHWSMVVKTEAVVTLMSAIKMQWNEIENLPYIRADCSV